METTEWARRPRSRTSTSSSGTAPTPVVQSVLAYRDVCQVPGPVDLAVVVVPARDVVDAARACAEKGVARWS